MTDISKIDMNRVNELPTVKSNVDDLITLLESIDYVIESKLPTSNDPKWYRLYKSGWVEQGGYITGANTTSHTFLIPFMDTNYTLTGGLLSGTESATYEHMNFKSLSTTGFSFTTYDSYKCKWYACGQSSQSN